MTPLAVTAGSIPSEDPLNPQRVPDIPYTVSSLPVDRLESRTERRVSPSATSTEGATSLPSETTPAAADAVVSEVAGVVLNEAGESLLVRLSDQNVTVHFPRVLFSEELIHPGTPVTYQIVRRKDGVRHQRFVKRAAEIDAERVVSVLGMLDQIRFRAE